jgi:hypothetical protein
LPEPAEPAATNEADRATPSDEAGLFASTPEAAPAEAAEAATGRPRWLLPAVAAALVAVVAVAIVALQPSLIGLGGEGQGAEPSAAGSRTAAPPSTAQRAPQHPQPSATASGTAAPSAASSVAPSSSATNESDAGPAASASADGVEGELPAVVDELGGDGSELLSFEGYLIVRSVAQVEVVVQGKPLGSTNHKLKARCHQKNVRLRDPQTSAWLTAGQPVRIQCMSTTTVVINP